MTLDNLGIFLHGLAEPLRPLNNDLADSLHWLASRLPQLDGRMTVPSVIQCEECEGNAILFEQICPSSKDFKAGYRALYRCSNPDCGEIYLK